MEKPRNVLEHVLIHQPEAMTTELLDRMIEVPLEERYRKLDLHTLLPRGAQTPSLRSVITALNILEKYGRNLLSPHRPKFWRSVKFNNPVFKTTVDAIEGGRHVLSLYGYTYSLQDGLGFPEDVLEPDTLAVAAVTADVIVLHHELNLLISNCHPHREKAEQELLGASPQHVECHQDGPSLVTDSVAIPHPTPSEGFCPPASVCVLCGIKMATVLCPLCNDKLCVVCDQRIHSHPNREHHQRSHFGIAASYSTREEEFISPLSSRPPWQCMTCHTLNRGGSVLCVGCDRPRGCANNLSNVTLETSMQKDTWECQACTFLNTSSAVLCKMCDRPRLARKPSRESHESPTLSLKDGKFNMNNYRPVPSPGKSNLMPENDTYKAMDLGVGSNTTKAVSAYSFEASNNGSVVIPFHKTNQATVGPLVEAQKKEVKSEVWQCSHCTFYNTRGGRVCEMCDRTSQFIVPADGKKTQDIQEQQFQSLEDTRQKRLKEEGAKLIALIKEGEACGVTPEEVYSAIRYSGTEVPLSWLQSELPYVLERVIDVASQKAGSELGAFTPEEARAAWVSSGGEMEDAVHLCIIQRRSMVEELCALGFLDRDKVVAALFESAGDVRSALCKLQAPLLEPFLRRVWDDKQPSLQLDGRDRQAILRRLLAEHALHSWGRAELALSLLQEGEGRYDLQDVVEAVRESQDRDFIKRMLTQECAVCGWELPRNKMRSLTSCECCICPECFRMHFTVAVKEKHIRDMVCPACAEPEISDEGELLHYFSTLDILLRDTLEVDAYNLFHKKLTERTLMKDPKFLWCTHCSFGFIYERDQLDVKCPQCACSFCRNCKRPWEEQHRSLTCDGFQNWKRENDAEYQAQGLAVYLQENGITCPHCKFSYALARGGCMHFICSQCRHQFCSGCYNTFHSKNKCTVPSCTVKKSLHAHHPRDCLFYLRDWEVLRLQKLLQMSNVQFNTDPPAGTQAGPGGGCRVMEQKESIDGMRDEACGKQTVHGYAGLCESHYKEYLVSRINALSLDPCVLYDLEEAITVCRRYLLVYPQQEANEDDVTYRETLLRIMMSELPLSQNRHS